MSSVPENCATCGAASTTVPIDGGGKVIAYNCTAELVIATFGANPTVIKTCPEPAVPAYNRGAAR